VSLTELLAAFDPNLPLERARTIPSSWYRDASLYEAERRHVFGNAWLAAGRAELVREPGSYLTAEIAGEPVLVVRDEAGTLRAFANVCRHRAAPVMTGCAGRATKLRCRYHGWTYDLAGRLRGVPEFEDVACFAREDNGLPPLAVDVWGSLVWVHAGRPQVPLAEYLDPLPRLAGGLGLESLRHAGQRVYDLACNWKVYVDNYLDGGYHINSVHPGLAGVLDYSQYRNDLGANACVQHSPIRPAAPGSEAVGSVRAGERAYYGWVFPHVMVNAYQGCMDTNVVLPLGPERCRVVFDFYFGEATGQQVADSIAVSHQVQLEDVGICEEVQRGLASRTFDTGRYSVRREGPVHAFHVLLAQHLLQR
jgi:choline monooxygenase